MRKGFLFTLFCFLSAVDTVQAGVLSEATLDVVGDCRSSFTQGYITQDDNYSIIFSDLNTLSNGDVLSKTCGYLVSITVPNGYKLAVEKLILDGAFSVDRGEQDFIALGARIDIVGRDQITQWSRITGDQKIDPSFAQGNTGSFSISHNVNQLLYSECGEDVTINAELALVAGGFGSLVSLDQQIMVLNLQLKNC